MLEIHPSARENFDLKADSFFQLLQAAPSKPKIIDKFPTETHSITITDKDIIGDIDMRTTDYKGNILERFFASSDGPIGLRGDDYQKLFQLAESIQRLPAIREKLSLDFVIDIFFLWFKERYENNSDDVKFITYLDSCAEEHIKPMIIYVPIANTIVENPFEFCGQTIENISKKMVDNMASVIETADAVNKDAARIYIENFRKDFQGFAAVKIQMECEPRYAISVGVEKAKRITELLGIYSTAILIPDVKSISKIKGSENFEQCTVIVSDDEGMEITSSVIDKVAEMQWKISINDIEAYKKLGFDILSDMVSKPNASDFEKNVLSMAYLYARAAFTSEPMDKLVYMLSALESILLKNENEPIQQNLAERMAIITDQTLESRRAIIKNVKTVYGLRSRYLHHGYSSTEMSELSDFFIYVGQFFINLLHNASRFTDKNSFLNTIDDLKLG